MQQFLLTDKLDLAKHLQWKVINTKTLTDNHQLLY